MTRLAEKSLTPTRRRRAQRWHRAFTSAYLAAMLGVLAVGARSEWMKERKVEAPTWAAFKMVGTSPGTEEWARRQSDDGVPNSLVVNGEQWSVVEVNHFDDATAERVGSTLAQTYCDNNSIAFIHDQDPRRLRISLMHEVFHAGDCLHGGDAWWNSEHPTDEVHPGVYHLGEFMSVFAHDNPAFMEWEEQ